LGAKYLVVLCAGSTLPLAKQSLDEASYKLSGAVAKLAGITFLSLAFSWTDTSWFLTEGKACCCAHHTFLLGFPTGRGFTSTHRAASRLFSGAVAGEKKTSARGVLHAHPLLCFKFCFTLFLLASFYQKHKKN
jgi:hypothetical protein